MATTTGTPSAAQAKAPPRTYMSLATAQRRILWNAGGLAVLWGIGTVWPSSVDAYYRLTDWLMMIDGVPDGTDEVLDSVLLWLRMALTIVFILNTSEAALRLAFPPATVAPRGDTASLVGETLARRISGPAAPSASTYRASPVTPVPGASASPSHSPSLRTSPTHLRTSPFRAVRATPTPAPGSSASAATPTLGLGRPSSVPTPFPMRASTPAMARHVSPARDVLLRSPRLPHPRSPQTRSVSPASFRSDWDDAWEVEQALRTLSTPQH